MLFYNDGRLKKTEKTIEHLAFAGGGERIIFAHILCVRMTIDFVIKYFIKINGTTIECLIYYILVL